MLGMLGSSSCFRQGKGRDSLQGEEALPAFCPVHPTRYGALTLSARFYLLGASSFL